MEVIRNTKKGEFGIEGEVFFDLFDKYIDLSVEDDELDYAQKCAAYLNQIPETVVRTLCNASIRYCNDFLEATGQKRMIFDEPQEVLNHIYPSVLLVPYPDGAPDPVIHLELNCSWEPEHGLEWVVRGDEVQYVGAFNGEDPLGSFDQKQPWNYA